MAADLRDLAIDLAAGAASFRSGPPGGIQSFLAQLVPAVNCYCSNPIKGHNTHPIDIERAPNNDFSADPEHRDLQLEARAHIELPPDWAIWLKLRGHGDVVQQFVVSFFGFGGRVGDHAKPVAGHPTQSWHELSG